MTLRDPRPEYNVTGWFRLSDKRDQREVAEWLREQGPMTVPQLHEASGMPVPKVTLALLALRERGEVECDKQGRCEPCTTNGPTRWRNPTVWSLKGAQA